MPNVALESAKTVPHLNVVLSGVASGPQTKNKCIDDGHEQRSKSGGPLMRTPQGWSFPTPKLAECTGMCHSQFKETLVTVAIHMLLYSALAALYRHP